MKGWETLWRCPNGHVMGVVRDGRLAVLREADRGGETQGGETQGGETPPLRTGDEVLVVLNGWSRAVVRCTICGKKRTWMPERVDR